jgi:putative CRISPR-associated protein (TIGR02619 family)
LQAIIDARENQLLQASVAEAQKLSAELNTLITFYQQPLAHKQDFHFLLCTDTYLGEATARMVEKWLKQHVTSQVEVYRQKDLQTKSLLPFQLALTELVRKLSQDLPQWRSQNYRIIFNLTGGFKSVQGFLQSIAHFYADETLYIFESATELLRIPHLPIQLDLNETVLKHLHTFRRLAQSLPCSDAQMASMPEIFIFQIDGQTTLSPWGELVWEQSKKALYAEHVYEPPSERIVYSDKFKKTVAYLSADRKILVNERMDQLACCLETTPSQNPPSLDFKSLQGNPKPPCTHECDAWSDQDAKRIFAYFSEDKHTLILENLERKFE